jgi:flagellar motor switch protein FliN/FliY
LSNGSREPAIVVIHGVQGGTHRVADESKPIGQDEVEALLAQARGAGGTPAATPSAPAPASPDVANPDAGAALGQSDIEALLQQSGGAATAAAANPPSARATASNMEGLLNQAQQALASVDAPATPLPPGVKPFEFRTLSGRPASTDAATLDLLRDVQLDLKIELGRTHMQLDEVLQLKSGAVVTLDKLAGDPVDVFVNGRLIARGEVLVMNDNFCVRVAELVAGESAVA